MATHGGTGHRGATPKSVAFYNPASNGYDLAKDPRCVWGWGPPDCDHMHGHACFRPYGHAGRCWDSGEKPAPDDPACYSAQRPADWDKSGRAAANA